jgi:hypothetical protein
MASGPLGPFGFEQTSLRTCPPLDADHGIAVANAVSHPGAMMCLERIERPIGIGHHSNPSLSADQDGHFGRCVARSRRIFRRIEDLNGVVYESAHDFLIGTEQATLNVFS